MKKTTHEIEGGRKLYMYAFGDQVMERQRKYWSSVGDAWREEAEAIEEWMEPLTRAIHAKIGDYPRIALDVGCGSRSMSLPPRWRVFGVDPVAEILTAGKSVQGSSQMLPFQDSAVDAVVSRLALMLDSEPGRVFAEVRRILRMGGTFTFVVWDKRESNLWASAVEDVLKAELSIRDARPDEPSAYRLADDAEVASLLRASGLRVISSERVHVPFFSSMTPDATFDFLLKYIGPVRLLFGKVAEDRKAEIRSQVIARLSEVSRNGSAWIHHAEREVRFD